MRLGEFIRANPDDIEQAWEAFARKLTPFAADLTNSVLSDGLRDILMAMADDMDTGQTFEEQQAKSQGYGPRGGVLDRITAVHANERLTSGFDLEHTLAEYRALRSSILFLWVRSAPKSEDIQLSEVTRFNETIDQAIAEVVRRFTTKNELLNDRFVESIKASQPEAIFTFEKIGDVTGMWDKSRLQQMIFNLASNAVTHSSDQQATIALRAANADVTLTISNQGKAIPADQQQLIFEPFVHKGGLASAQPSSGLGLGLFVVRQIVQAHKGSIEVASGDIDGTTFTVRLPRSAGGRP